MSAPGVIAYGTIVPQGTGVLAVWPTGTTLPGDDVLQGAVAQFGDPFKLTYWSQEHVGVRLSADTAATAIGVALAEKTAGNAPLLLSMPPDTEAAVEIEIGGEIVKENIETALRDFRTLTTGPLSPGGGSAIPWLIGGAILGLGLVAVGAVVYLTRKK